MKIVRGLTNARPSDRGFVLTIGNFDGLHLGHEAIVGHLAARGREHGLPTALLTFEPNPREWPVKGAGGSALRAALGSSSSLLSVPCPTGIAEARSNVARSS